jgi:hypothetical protein
MFVGGVTDPLKAPLSDLADGRLTPPKVAPQHSCAAFTDEAVRFLKGQAGGPFLCYVAFNAPHDPHTVPVDFPVRYDPAALPLPPNYLPQHPWDNGEMANRDERLLPWPRTPEHVRAMLADYYRYVSYLDVQGTEHLPGASERTIPLFPELRLILDEAFYEAEPGTVYVVNRYRDATKNLRAQMLRIIRRAGLTPWPKPFHNLRASRATELAEDYPVHVVCEWIGNAERIAAKHYLQVTDDHFVKAATAGAAKCAATALQNATVTAARENCQPSLETTKAPETQGSSRELTSRDNGYQFHQVTPTGFEPVSQP